MSSKIGIINNYFSYLPVKDPKNIVTLDEGNTPLLRAKNLEDYLDTKPDLFKIRV